MNEIKHINNNSAMYETYNNSTTPVDHHLRTTLRVTSLYNNLDDYPVGYLPDESEEVD